MSNGYGSSSSSSRSTTNAEGKIAPPGFHYMPDGTLMSDLEHERRFSVDKIIRSFDMNLNHLPSASKKRIFTIEGDEGAEFTLEVKADRSGVKYYNFYNNTFTSSTPLKLEGTIGSNGIYRGQVVFPTVLGSDDQYDITLFALPGTKHAPYTEARFADGSLDLNGSSGSNSLVLKKVIHQIADKTLTITPFTPAATTDLIKASTRVDQTITCEVRGSVAKQAFTISCEVNAATKSYTITRQPTPEDIFSFHSATVGSAPETLPGENIYPSVTNTDTVDGAVSEADKIVMDTNVADKMEVGDRVTGTGLSSSTIFTVRALNPDGDNAKEFQISQAVSLDDGVTLSFSNQMNYQWPLNDIEPIDEGMIVYANTNVTSNSKVANYEDSVTLFEASFDERILVKNFAPFKDTKNQTPTVSKGVVTVQPGNVVFDKQQKLALAGDAIRIGGYGQENIQKTNGYELLFTDLKLELTPITTTTTSAVSNSTNVPVASRNGILDSVSTVSGIGINPALANPTVSSGAGAVSGAGTIVLSAAQTLEDGITLTFSGAGQVATITGNIEVIKAGDADATIRFDMDRLLSIT